MVRYRTEASEPHPSPSLIRAAQVLREHNKARSNQRHAEEMHDVDRTAPAIPYFAWRSRSWRVDVHQTLGITSRMVREFRLPKWLLCPRAHLPPPPKIKK